MRIATILGTRPEIIRLSKVIEALDQNADHTLVHTGQNFDANLSDVFFQELKVRKPDHWWGVTGSGHGGQIAQIIERSAAFFEESRPDRVLILGDTNSGLAALVAARMGIPVYHMEAGNRCYDDRVPEETNRRVIDQCSSVLMPYTHRSKENLLHEGFPRHRIFVTGNPIYEVLTAHENGASQSDVLERQGLQPKRFCAVTLHRAENVDDPLRLQQLLKGLELVSQDLELPVIVSLHPRTKDRIQKGGLSEMFGRLTLVAPLSFYDFVKLESNAACVLTDSGTVQEEAAILGVPNVVVRDVTERAEAIEAGSGVLTGSDPVQILSSVKYAIERGCNWTPPTEYLQPNVSSIVAGIVLGYRHAVAA